MKLFVTSKDWGNGNVSYTASINNNQEGDQKANMFLDLQFKRGKEPIFNKCLIAVNGENCFFSCFNSKQGVKPKLIIMDCEVLTNYDEQYETKGVVVDPSEEGLPF